MNTCERIYVYILNKIGCLDICARTGNKRIKTIKNTINGASQYLEDDFNIKNIVLQMKKVMANASLNKALLDKNK